MHRGGHLAYVSLVGLAALLAGCVEHQYVVDDAVVHALINTPPNERAPKAIAVTRMDGTPAVVRANTILLDEMWPAGPGRSRMRAHHGWPLVGAGGFLDLLGTTMVVPGALALASLGPQSDSGLPFVLGISLSVFGAGHLVPGLILTACGGAASPEDTDGRPLLTPSATPPAR